MKVIPFQAQWTQENSHLQSSIKGIYNSTHLTGWQKTSLIFHRIIESIIDFLCPRSLQSLARKNIVPCTDCEAEVYKNRKTEWMHRWEKDLNPSVEMIQLRAAYEPVELQLKTPEGINVKGILYQHKGTENQDIPTILCFNGNGDLAHGESWDWLLKKGCRSAERGQSFNVMVLDYANDDVNPVSEHAKNTSVLKHSKDLVVYGDTLFQAAKSLGISEKNIHFMGYSLGGAVSALVAELHPLAGRVVNLKSFSSMDKVMTDPTGPMARGIPSCPKRWLLAKLTAAIGWTLEPAWALNKLKRKILFAFTEKDEILPPAVAAVNAMGYNGMFGRLDYSINLQLKSPELQDGHNAPLRCYNDAFGNKATNVIMNFILGRGEIFRIKNKNQRIKFKETIPL